VLQLSAMARMRAPHCGRRLATVVVIATIPAAAGTLLGLELAGAHGDAVVLPAVAVSGAGGALTRRLLGTEPLQIAFPVAHPRRVALATVGATMVAFAAATLVAGGSAVHAAWFALLGVSASDTLAARLFYKPRPRREPGAERAFSLELHEADRLRDESLRGVLPRGF
jgi:hypothetical protein